MQLKLEDKMQVLNENQNKLVGRKEIRARITYEGATPNRKDLLSKFKAKNVVIRRIKPEFGSSSAIVEAVEYTSKEVMDKLEAEHIKKRHIFEEPKKEEAPVTEAPAEEKPVETPVEKVKEEVAEKPAEEAPEKKEGDSSE